jgi:hypothetical protein
LAAAAAPAILIRQPLVTGIRIAVNHERRRSLADLKEMGVDAGRPDSASDNCGRGEGV